MRIRLGPILGFRGQEHGTWHVSALIEIGPRDTAQQLEWRSSAGGAWQAVTASMLKSTSQSHVARYSLAVAQADEEQIVEYRVGQKGPWRFRVPGLGAHPRMAFVSCNGFSDPKHMKEINDPNARWADLKKVHARQPFHLLLMGGDQIYADSIWSRVDRLEDWNGLRKETRIRRGFRREMRRSVERFYADLYRRRWSQDAPAAVWSQIPMLATWDDHDIFDGWGSYDHDLQSCKVFQGIFQVAREYFSIFQLQCRPEEEAPPGAFEGQRGFSFGHRIGDLALLFIDTRSERTLDRIVSEQSWQAIFRWLDALKDRADGSRPKHLLVVTAVPVAYPRMRLLETIAGWDFRHEQKRIEDDLRDHWTTARHHGERLRLIHHLFDFAAEASCRVTVLSGDVHVAAMGVIEAQRGRQVDRHANVITQLVSSPVVHAPPGDFIRWALDRMAEEEDEIDRDVRMRMLELPGLGRRIHNERNWLELEVDAEPRLWAHWHFEGKDSQPRTKVIHPVGDTRSA